MKPFTWYQRSTSKNSADTFLTCVTVPSGYYPPPPFTHSRNMVNCNHLLMSMFIMFFSLSNCVQYGLRRVQQILATKSYITRFQTKLSRYRRADRPQLQILLSHVESQKPVKTVATMYIQRLLPGGRFPLSVISSYWHLSWNTGDKDTPTFPKNHPIW